MKLKLYGIVLMALCGVLNAFGAKVTGLVLDEQEQPLPGATVSIKGTKTVAVTDVDGQFTIEGETGQTVVVSYIGFQATEAKIPASKNLTIVLKETSSSLDEVVVVGVSMKKSDLTGSVSRVDADVLTEKPVTNINDALAGRVAGVSIGKASSPSDDNSIKIRGTNTINSGSAPIYVVDGLVMGNDFGFYNSINVNDVESIQILKDASATALYGSRGANGVVLVTTKKGKKGNAEVSYDGWVSFSTMGHRPETMGAQDLFNLRVNSFANGYMYNNPTANRQDYIDNTLLNSNIAFEDREFATWRAGKSYDWLKQVTRTGVQHNHNLSFSKATEGTNFYMSMGINQLEGIMKGTSQDRYSGRINASADITKWLSVGTNTSYTYQKDDMTNGNVYNMARNLGNPLLDYGPFMDEETRRNPENLMLFYRVQSGETNNNFNPFNSLDIVTDRKRYHLTSSNYININPIEGLNIRSTFAINHGEQQWNQFVPTGIQESIRNYSGDAYATQQRFSETQWQWDNTISYDKTFNYVHRVNAFFGTSTSRKSYNDLKGEGRKFASNDLGYNGLFGASVPDERKIYNSSVANSLMSYVVRGNYSYDSRYYATFTGRWDGSSKFAEGHRWGFFPSFSLAWDLTNEHFFPKLPQVNQIKIRGGYGVVGNQDIGDFMYATLYSPPAPSNGTPSYNTDGRRGTPDITWEKQKQTNIAVDMSFFNRQLNVTVEGYWINNSNLLLSHSLPSTSGYTYTTENVGELQNRGMDVTIEATPIRTRDWTWNISANLGFDRNKITKLYGNVERILGNWRWDNYFVGESMNNVYTLLAGGIANEWNRDQWEGVDYNGRTIGLGDLYALDISGPDGVKDGVVDSYDRTICGRLDPKFYGGFSTDLTWKGLSLNAVFNYSVGGKKISEYYEGLISSIGESMASPDLNDAWTPENTGGYFPRRMRNADGYSAYGAGDTNRYLQDSSFLRLSTLSVSYSLPKSILNKIRFNNLRFYFTASNVFCVTKYKGYDPEYGDGGGYFPAERTYTIGLSFSLF